MAAGLEQRLRAIGAVANLIEAGEQERGLIFFSEIK